jgi:hypothetical protein
LIFNADVKKLINTTKLSEPYNMAAKSFDTSDLLELETKLDLALESETKESLTEFIEDQRKDEGVERPTPGIVPRFIIESTRFREICTAIDGRLNQLQNIPIEWVIEYNELVPKVVKK